MLTAGGLAAGAPEAGGAVGSVASGGFAGDAPEAGVAVGPAPEDWASATGGTAVGVTSTVGRRGVRDGRATIVVSGDTIAACWRV